MQQARRRHLRELGDRLDEEDLVPRGERRERRRERGGAVLSLAAPRGERGACEEGGREEPRGVRQPRELDDRRRVGFGGCDVERAGGGVSPFAEAVRVVLLEAEERVVQHVLDRVFVPHANE